MNSTKKYVTNQWTKLSSYVFLKSTWTLNCETGRQCEVGVGWFIRGKPRGEKYKFKNHIKVTTFGAGKVMARVIDGKGPCKIMLDHGDMGVISITIPAC